MIKEIKITASSVLSERLEVESEELLVKFDSDTSFGSVRYFSGNKNALFLWIGKQFRPLSEIEITEYHNLLRSSK